MLGSLVGDVPAAPGYWKYVREVCDKYNVHLILDEVYCGMGRSGRIYCCDWDGVRPDFVCVGKNLAGGYAPLSAIVTNSRVEEVIANGSGRIQLGHTYQGYSLGVAAAMAVQKIVHSTEMLAHINETGQYMRDTLVAELGRHPFFCEVRGRGLIFSLEYDCPNKHQFGLTLQRIMEEKHSILINAKWHRVSFVPPYIITRTQVDYVIERFIATFNRVASDWSRLKATRESIRAGALGGIKVGQ